MAGRAERTNTGTSWWRVVGSATTRGDFAAVERDIARAWSARNGPADLALIWTATAALAALRGNYVAAEVAFAEAVCNGDASAHDRCAAVARITRAECMAPVTPGRSIDDARRALAAGGAGSPAILHQARMALIAGHRAAGDVDVAVALGERLLAGPLSPLDRGRALGAQGMSLIAADATDGAIAVLTEAIPIFEQVDAPWFAAITEIALSGVDPTCRRELHASARARAGCYADDPAWRRVLNGDNAPELAPTTRVPSARELVLALVARGFTTRQVADALIIQPSTVESHVRHSMHLTGAATRSQLVYMHRTIVDDGAPPMTCEERELLDLVASGCTTKEIAVRLHFSSRTVTRRLRVLKQRFGVPSIPALVAAASS